MTLLRFITSSDILNWHIGASFKKRQVYQNTLLLQGAGIVGGNCEKEEEAAFFHPVNSQQGLTYQRYNVKV